MIESSQTQLPSQAQLSSQTQLPPSPQPSQPSHPGCHLCPRDCSAPRTVARPGFCGADDGLIDPQGGYIQFRVARVMVHEWEEPFISGSRGSGAVFFSGCSLGCSFCQNGPISHGHQGLLMDGDALIDVVLDLQSAGVHNLNLVTPSHVADRLPEWLRRLGCQPAWQDQPLPVIWNSSGYETVDSLLPLQGLVQIYLPDLKFHDAGLSRDLAGAADYFTVAAKAILEMHRQQPEPVWSPDGLLRSGLVVRHLVLPGHWRDSCRLIDFMADTLPLSTPLSLMSQYTPQVPHPGLPSSQRDGAPSSQPLDDHPEMNRRLTTYEYRKVVDYAQDRGFGHILTQERSSASSDYTPDFSERFRPGRT